MDKASVLRMIGLFVVMLNAIMAIFGISFVIPAEFNEALSSVILVVYGFYVAWKNNYISKKGLKQKEILKKNNLTK